MNIIFFKISYFYQSMKAFAKPASIQKAREGIIYHHAGFMSRKVPYSEYRGNFLLKI